MEHISDPVNVNKCGIGILVLHLGGKALAEVCPCWNIYCLCNNWQVTYLVANSSASFTNWESEGPLSQWLAHVHLCVLTHLISTWVLRCVIFKIYLYLWENQDADRWNDLPKLKYLGTSPRMVPPNMVHMTTMLCFVVKCKCNAHVNNLTQNVPSKTQVILLNYFL